MNKRSLKKKDAILEAVKKKFEGKKDEKKESEEKKMGKTLWKLETSRKWLKGYLDNAAMRDDTQSISTWKKCSLLAVSFSYDPYLKGMKVHINLHTCSIFQLLKASFDATKIF